MDRGLNDILNSLPDKPARSRLTPYADLIDELRGRGWTYRGIAGVLTEKCGVRVSASNLHHFVKSKASTKVKTGDDLPPTTARVMSQSSEANRRIAALKRQTTKPELDESEFTFDPTVPLRIKQARDEP